MVYAPFSQRNPSESFFSGDWNFNPICFFQNSKKQSWEEMKKKREGKKEYFCFLKRVHSRFKKSYILTPLKLVKRPRETFLREHDSQDNDDLKYCWRSERLR